jgi:hypothetical protein
MKSLKDCIEFYEKSDFKFESSNNDFEEFNDTEDYNSEETLCSTDYDEEEEFDSFYESESEIKSEEDFREYAENKFETVYGDDLDEDKMDEIIEGILKDYKKEAEEGDWGTLIGVLNKSFGS